MWVIVLLFFLFAIAVTGLVLGAISIARDNQGGTFFNSTLVHPTSGNFSGKVPTIGSVISNVSTPLVAPGSTDTSGRVDGTVIAGAVSSVSVVFGTPFATAPKAVVATIANSHTSITDVGVIAQDATGFTVGFTTTAGFAQGKLFYYIVL